MSSICLWLQAAPDAWSAPHRQDLPRHLHPVSSTHPKGGWGKPCAACCSCLSYRLQVRESKPQELHPVPFNVGHDHPDSSTSSPLHILLSIIPAPTLLPLVCPFVACPSSVVHSLTAELAVIQPGASQLSWAVAPATQMLHRTRDRVAANKREHFGRHGCKGEHCRECMGTHGNAWDVRFGRPETERPERAACAR